MAEIRCPFCHQLVDEKGFAAHREEHVKPRPDGQQKDYATLPEGERDSSELAGVPRIYVHQVCGVATQMPEEIVRTYLKDPFFYSDETFCCGCRRHVPHNECFWRETGENLQDYNDRLRLEKQAVDESTLNSLSDRKTQPNLSAPKKGCLAVMLWGLAGFALFAFVMRQ